MFTDLHKVTKNLSGYTLENRVHEASKILPPVSIVAIGGIPIREIHGVFTLMGNPVNPDLLKKNLVDLLGMSAALTYLNPNHKSIEELGAMCMDLNHTWAYHSVVVSVLFNNPPSFVEKSFGRDGSFMQGSSWVEILDRPELPNIFAINGSLKDWKRYVEFRKDPTFKLIMRNWLELTHEVLNSAYPNVII